MDAEERNQRWWAPGDKLAPWIIQVAGIVMVFSSFAAVILVRMPVEQASLFAGAGCSMVFLGRSFNIGGK